MTENERERGVDVSGASDETLRRYLLCGLDDDERLRLDERLLIDDELAAALLLAESELTDDYASGGLNAVERESFEKSFLTTESRRQMLGLSSALHDYAGSQAPLGSGSPVAQPEKTSWQEALAALFGFGRPRVWAVAGSFALLVMFAGLVLFATRQRRDTEPVVTRNDPAPTLSPQALPRAEASPAAQSAHQPQPTPSRKPAVIPIPSERAIPATIASFVLLPGALRDGGDMTRIAVPDGKRDIVRLNLVMEAESGGVYQAEVATAEGQKVTILRRLKADNRKGDPKLTIDIPAPLLPSGDYQIKLTRQKTDGQLEAVGRYYFRALGH